MDKYIFSKEIGRGSFGKVYLIESKHTGIQYVLKQIDLNKMDKKQVKTASKEVEVLSKLKHSHIVRYKESYEAADRLNIIMEYCENGDLHKKIKQKRIKNECFSDDEILDYFVQISLAVEYIHELKILHRDLKSKNIFLTKGNLIKLGDFGVAKILENSFELANTCIGSPYYISPEICENKPYNKKSDIWALGCVLYELVTLKYAFVAKNVKILIAKISSGTFNPLPMNVNPVIKSLLINLLKPNPKDRPTASEILRKPFLKKFRFKYSSECSVLRKRSNSGDNSKKCPKLNNEVRLLSISCTNVNETSRFINITKPETKYKVPFFNNRLKCLKKNIERKNNSEIEQSREGILESKGPVKNRDNWETTKIIRLPKVDSEYYNLIAESNNLKSLDSENLKGSSFQANDWKTKSEELRSVDHTKEMPGQKEEEPQETRRRWMANTVEKKELLTILSEAKLIDITLINGPEIITTDKEYSKLTVDDLLKLDPSEMSEDILQPIKIGEKNRLETNTGDCYLTLLKEEVKEIKLKFETNNGKWNLDDLVKLTKNTLNILRMEDVSPRHAGHGNFMKNESESVYFDLELKRMELEKTIGLNKFLTAYKKMIDILNGNIQMDPPEEYIRSGSATYVLSNQKKYSVDHRKEIERMWKSVMEEIGAKQQYIPDIWECAVRECVYY